MGKFWECAEVANAHVCRGMSLTDGCCSTVFIKCAELLKKWADLDVRNVLREDNPHKIVNPETGMMDYAIDADQSRMHRVYSRDASTTTCPLPADPAEMNRMTKDCPSAIPIRDGYVTGTICQFFVLHVGNHIGLS